MKRWTCRVGSFWFPHRGRVSIEVGDLLKIQGNAEALVHFTFSALIIIHNQPQGLEIEQIGLFHRLSITHLHHPPTSYHIITQNGDFSFKSPFRPFLNSLCIICVQLCVKLCYFHFISPLKWYQVIGRWTKKTHFLAILILLSP